MNEAKAHKKYLESLDKKERWLGEVYDALQEVGDISQSDAQGVAGAKEALCDKCWSEGQTPEETARLLLGN